jgi:hypothetical protein
MNIIKESIITSKFLRKEMKIEDFFSEIVLPSGYTYFEWDGFIYKVCFDENNNPRFNPTGNFYSIRK